jgi:tetratricopeptide (TPR) repeat protein
MRLASVALFCSRANIDEDLRIQLESHLGLLQREGMIALWQQQQIIAGANWQAEVDQALATAQLVLLLISPDFLADESCHLMMKRAMQRHLRNETRVIPILLRPVDLRGASFRQLKILPGNGKPITMWSNRDAAFVDIVAGIRAILEVESYRATGQPRVWNVPYSRNFLFTGRDDVLEVLCERLKTGQSQGLSGLGGIGKTQVAVEYAYRYAHLYQAILWSRAGTREDLISGFTALAHLLALPQKEMQDQQVMVQAVKNWLQNQTDWLLILDNADDLALVSDFLPTTGKGHVLLTTRATSMGRLVQRLEIKTLQPEEGAAFVLRRAALLTTDAVLDQAVPEEVELALELVEEMGGLPLALDQAGAYIEETQCGLANYLHLYRRHHARLLNERGGLVPDHPEPVATTWALSFARVEQANPAAADVLRVCVFLQPDAIPEEILLEGARHLGPHIPALADDPLAFNQALKVLLSYSLIQRNPTERLLFVHPLVQVVLKDTMDESTFRLWGERTVQAVETALPDVDHSAVPRYDRCIAHALGCALLIEQLHLTSLSATALLHQTGLYLAEHARYAEAETFFQYCFHILMEQGPGSAGPHMTLLLNNMANLYYQQGKYAEAEPLFQMALDMREEVLGPEHPLVASPLHGLSLLYQDQGKYAEAEPLCRRALHIWEQALGPTHPQIAEPLNSLANLCCRQGKYAEAEPLYQRALHILEQGLSPAHLQVAYPLCGLANLYAEQRKYTEAESLFQRALYIRERILGTTHPEVAYPLHGLALLYYEQGKYAEAEPLFQRVLGIWESTLGSRHHQVAALLQNLANLYAEQGKYTEAEPLYQRALLILEQGLGPAHPQVASSLTSLGLLYAEQGKFTEAEPLYQHALRILEEALDPAHPQVAEPLANLALLYYVLGKYTEAEPLFQRALHVLEQAPSPNQHLIRTIAKNYAALLRAMKRGSEALRLEEHFSL